MKGLSRSRQGWALAALMMMLGASFDASGIETACGVVTIDEKNDAIVIAAVSK